MTFHSPPPTISTTLLGLLAACAAIPLSAAAEITRDDLLAKISPTAAAPGFNAEGGTVFENYLEALKNGQLFFIDTVALVYETPESDPPQYTSFYWCSDLTFSDISNSSLIGYAGRCAVTPLAGYDTMVASGAQLAFVDSDGEFEFTYTTGISAVYAEQQNAFEGQYHVNTDDWVYRFWDDGRKTTPTIVWESHDEGDMSPNAATSSVSGFGQVTWSSVDEVARLFNTSVDEFTPETFKRVYLNTWTKDHEKEAATDNPNVESELAIIEQVKNETNYVDGTAPTTPVESDSTVDGSDAANPVVEDDSDSGSGRQLASVAARFVSAALRVFGI